jgi:copper(I)-binding protein
MNIRFAKAAIVAACAVMAPPLSIAHAAPPSVAEYDVGPLKITAPWMRATPKGAAVAGGYFTVTNTGTASDRLISITSDLASVVQLHEMSMNGGVMTMREVDKPVEIKPGATLALKPGGYHLMFMHLNRPAKQGDTVKATLTFEKAGKVDIEIPVGGFGATGPGSAAAMKM